MSSVRPRWIVLGACVLAVVVALVSVVVATNAGSSATTTASGTAIAENPDFGPVGSTEQVPCPTSIAAGAAFQPPAAEVEGQTYSCGVVVVPEDHAKPDGRTIELFYLKLHSAASSPAAVPMVYLAGGPGGSGSAELSSNPALKKNIDVVRQTRDVIAYDQRGTGYSNYLLCAPFESTLAILQDRDKNPQIATAIKDLQDTTLGIGYGALRANLCGVGTKLLAGTDLQQYNSVSSAKDIPILASALGYTEGYSVYGTSYGTKLAQVAMKGDPTGVKAVVLDGVGGPSIPNGMWASTKDDAAYQAIFAQCAADAACNAAYPDLEKRFAALLATLAKKPLVVDPPIVVFPALSVSFPPVLKQIDPSFFQHVAVINNIAFGGGFAAQVPRMILAAEQGDTDWFRASRISVQPSDPKAPAQQQQAVPTTGDGTLPVQYDRPLYEVPFTTLIGIAQNAVKVQQPTLDGQWLTVVLGDLAVQVVKGGNQADLMESLLRLAVLPNGGVSADALKDFADKNLTEQSAQYADALVDAMSRNDVRATMWGIQDVAMTLGSEPDSRSFSNGMQYAVNCSDELAFTSLDEAKKNLADSPFPELALIPLEANEQTLLTCLSYTTALDRSITDPVSSDIPALVYLESLDNETPVTWGREAAKGLSKATVVEWQNSGHVVAAKDDKLCAGGIVAAFLADPSSVPDTSCSEAADYRLTFALP